MKVDFHCHSTASDGTVRPAELARMAGGFAAFALTDHDNADGVEECRAECAALGVPFLAGIELSIEPGEGFDRFHLLGIGIDPSNAALKRLLARILEGRNARNERIIANFARLGIEIPPDEIAAYAHGDVLARPHFAKWLADHGYAPSPKAAFEAYLLPDSPDATRCYEDRWHPPQEETFAAIHGAGGLCVMAHPKFWRRSWRSASPDYGDAKRELARLKEAGLDGLEARYQADTPSEDVHFTMIADELGLLKTAGSDFHGANKPDIPIGMEVKEEFIAPFLAAALRG